MRDQAILGRPSEGHPFRATLPVIRANVRKREDDSDLKLFVLSYCAFFVCFYTFFL
ncbi:hypothetical protein OK349_02185 [Sphingomonas sp. BT-65]|uniref:hypothetical protein n=1 Tax=Sphingomonas sp. BT-65 TaxID=2989821 RepID=UPI002235F47C|nr:hypothetical protein [Sphingomonas sp. BT-65]MCW4460499.1 hypothetical protein [Sphingomonas sp. BT-65]